MVTRRNEQIAHMQQETYTIKVAPNKKDFSTTNIQPL